jgi:hypothetical protein
MAITGARERDHQLSRLQLNLCLQPYKHKRVSWEVAKKVKQQSNFTLVDFYVARHRLSVS